MKRWILFFSLSLFAGNIAVGGRNTDSLRITREIYVIRVTEHININGRLDEKAWNKSDVASNFTIYEPYNGLKASQQSEVRVLYDDFAIYIGARLYDTAPDSIFRELGQRDNSDRLRSDAFSVFISTYNDGVNFLQFTVSASGVQTDIKLTSNKSDRNWNAVWESAVGFDSLGWTVEMKIPYSALRFAMNENQIWGINFSRLIKRKNEVSTWNFVDNAQAGFITQSGILKGISGIKPPLRLSFLPYISGYVDQYAGTKGLDSRVSGGMDLKLGLAQSFTLDVTLIPDFGQVRSDDKVLNLTPFEVKYDEARQFFTEGTELFGKAGIFYSRRIGGTPIHYNTIYNALNANEIVEKNPLEAKMINASKLSGRFANGLGFGFFNAMTENTYAEILDTVSGKRRKLLTQGFTNYNITVFDQNIPNNSYVSLINTNVYCPIDSFTANVTATEFNLKNKKQSFSISGVGALSQRFVDSVQQGFKSNLSISKISGNIQGHIWANIESEHYNPNDLGYLRSPNVISSGVDLSYKVFEPFWKILNMEARIDFSNSWLYTPNAFQSQRLAFRVKFTNTQNFTGGFNASYNPRYGYDYYEPRVEGQKFQTPRVLWLQWWGSPDYRRTFVMDHRFSFWFADMYNQKGYMYSLSPRIRFSDRLITIYSWAYQSEQNNIGYYAYDGSNILFGSRKLVTITNTLNIQLAFTAKSFLNIRARHYIRHFKYNEFFTLKNDGSLEQTNSITNPANRNYNLFNIDMFYQWHFAHGSELVFAWKNQAEELLDSPQYRYFNNIEGIWNSPQNNSLSIKILYYVDYQTIRKLKS
ncbi:MAG TPA: hypothetical protein ENN49_06960 [Bacteroidales bacterium]|nr:hypothetical protein [Bacteroidales bacterium]